MRTGCFIDLDNNGLTLMGGHESKRLLVDFVIEGDEAALYDLKNLTFGYEFYENKILIKKDCWPIAGMSFGKMKPGPITSAEIDLKIDTDYELMAWYKHEQFSKKDFYVFNSGKPFKMYDSMIWNPDREDWDMLKPRPNDFENDYWWNEETLEWDMVPHYPKDGKLYNLNRETLEWENVDV